MEEDEFLQLAQSLRNRKETISTLNYGIGCDRFKIYMINALMRPNLFPII